MSPATPYAFFRTDGAGNETSESGVLADLAIDDDVIADLATVTAITDYVDRLHQLWLTQWSDVDYDFSTFHIGPGPYRHVRPSDLVDTVIKP